MRKENCKDDNKELTETLRQIGLVLARIEGKIDVISTQTKGGGQRA